MAEKRTEWGVAVKGHRDEDGNLVVLWFKTRNNRHNEAMKLKAKGLDYHTFERQV